ncbi:MAG: WD40/YVTN/BNR-like repeat-containing protein, partial [Planctomycetaceae bacterium]
MPSPLRWSVWPAILLAVFAGRSIAQPPPALPESGKSATSTLDPSLLTPMKWRIVGPTSMGGRVVDLAVVESNPSTFWVASASGGLFKTTNNGVTFEPQFQTAGSISIGDVCVAPSDPNVLWVGTGEHNARNSVSWGDGVYKSTDGGKTWTHRGLKASFQIGRIAIHPTNPDVVYVGALGRLWGENEQRGLYKTEDGGKTWKKVLHVDDKTGVVDIAMHPRDPETLIVATYERKRDIYDGGDPAKRFAPGSALYKTSNGGRSWKKLTAGLPTVKLGRIGVAYSRSNPANVFAIIETERIGSAPPGTKQPAYMGIQGDRRSSRLTVVIPNGPAAKSGFQS